ncbi:MAG: cyclic nucleotide-binding domain-containing protein [Magnetococcales bacterium]|nr:cyclic nucleotide-binding domain-containing protein [Magnetococcales bacterium]
MMKGSRQKPEYKNLLMVLDAVSPMVTAVIERTLQLANQKSSVTGVALPAAEADAKVYLSRAKSACKKARVIFKGYLLKNDNRGLFSRIKAEQYDLIVVGIGSDDAKKAEEQSRLMTSLLAEVSCDLLIVRPDDLAKFANQSDQAEEATIKTEPNPAADKEQFDINNGDNIKVGDGESGGKAPTAESPREKGGKIPTIGGDGQSGGKIPTDDAEEQNGGEIPTDDESGQKSGNIPSANRDDRRRGLIPDEEDDDSRRSLLPDEDGEGRRRGLLPEEGDGDRQRRGLIPAEESETIGRRGLIPDGDGDGYSGRRGKIPNQGSASQRVGRIPANGDDSGDKFSPDKVHALMDRINFFHNFSKYEKRRCANTEKSIVTFEPGEKIIEEGGKDTFFYIILKGTVLISKQGVAINTMREGDFFGEMAFLTNTERSSSVIAEDSIVAYRLDRQKMKMMQSAIREKIKDQCITKLVEHMDRLTDRLLELM